MLEIKNTIPIFPLPETVLFPGMNLPLHIFEEGYKQMISLCLKSDKCFGIVSVKGNICAEVGTIAEIIDVEKLEDGKMNILTEGRNRFEIVKLITEKPFPQAEIKPYDDIKIKISDSLNKKIREIKELSSKALNILDLISEEKTSKNLKLPEDSNELLFLVAANLTCTHQSKQLILETKSLKERVDKIMPLLKEEIERLEVLLENKTTKDDVIKNGKLKL